MQVCYVSALFFPLPQWPVKRLPLSQCAQGGGEIPFAGQGGASICFDLTVGRSRCSVSVSDGWSIRDAHAACVRDKKVESSLLVIVDPSCLLVDTVDLHHVCPTETLNEIHHHRFFTSSVTVSSYLY